MRDKRLLLFVFAATLAMPSAAQTKVSGTMKCGKADPTYNIPVTDKPNHVFSLQKTQCTWSRPMEMAGALTKDGVSTAFAEVTGENVANHGLHQGTMANGDTYVTSFRGSAKSKEGVPQSAQGEWTFTGGTGKLKDVKGKGTYKGTVNPEGGLTFEVEGEYQVP